MRPSLRQAGTTSRRALTPKPISSVTPCPLCHLNPDHALSEAANRPLRLGPAVFTSPTCRPRARAKAEACSGGAAHRSDRRSRSGPPRPCGPAPGASLSIRLDPARLDRVREPCSRSRPGSRKRDAEHRASLAEARLEHEQGEQHEATPWGSNHAMNSFRVAEAWCRRALTTGNRTRD